MDTFYCSRTLLFEVIFSNRFHIFTTIVILIPLCHILINVNRCAGFSFDNLSTYIYRLKRKGAVDILE